MTKGVTVVRQEGKKLPDEFLAKIIETHGNCLGLGVAATDGSKVVLRKQTEPLKLEDVKKFLEHKALQERKVVLFFGSGTSTSQDDVQPFPVLTDGNGHILIVAFLSGNFEQFAEAGSIHAPEYFCLQKQIVPRVAKAYKLGDQDLNKTIEELKDPLHANDWSNMMIGKTGAITLQTAAGGIHTFLVEGDDINKEFDGWWTSNSLEETPAEVKEPLDDLEKELEGDGAPAQTELHLASSSAQKQTAGPARPPVVKSKSIASTDPIVAAAKPDGVASTDDQSAKSALGDPNATLTIHIPPGMDAARAAKWIRKRMPENYTMPKIISGLKTLTCKRSAATGAFIQTYLEQNKLAGLSEAIKSGTSVGQVASPPTKATLGLPSPKPEEKTTGAKPIASPAKDTSPHYVGVVEGPVPVFSPEQLKQLVDFTGTADFKAALDKHGKIIAEPGGPDKFEQMFANMTKQTGGTITPANVAAWPYEQHVAWIEKADKKAVATLQFWMGLELIKATQMLDELTEPHQKKQEQPVQTQTQQPTSTRRIAMPNRKAG